MMDSQQEVSTKTDMDDSDSAPTTCSGLSSTTSNNGHKAPQNANYDIRFSFKGEWKKLFVLWIVSSACFLTAAAYDSPPCKAGFRLEKHRHKEKCVPCGPNTFMPSNGHRNEACFLCREKEPTGSLTQIIWPCTWTSDTQIGCLREKGKEAYRHNGKDSGNCVPCGPRCEEGEIEIQQCTEYTDRTCQRQISGNGSDTKSIPSEIDSGDSSEETDGKTVESTTLPPLDSTSIPNVDTTPPPAKDSQKPPQNRKDDGTNNEFPYKIAVTVLLGFIATAVATHLAVSCYYKRKQSKRPIGDIEGKIVKVLEHQIRLIFEEYAIGNRNVSLETGFNDGRVFSERNNEGQPLIRQHSQSRDTGIAIHSSASTLSGTPASRRRLDSSN